ncbi:MAG: diguanylate cyclase [Clostridia bacterium]|nr:diguanylate cyclase [Clostridia bacterium]
MGTDLLIAYTIFQATFFVMDIFVLTRIGRAFINEEERKTFFGLIIAHMSYLLFNSLWTLQESEAIHIPHYLFMVICMFSYLSICTCAVAFFGFTVTRLNIFSKISLFVRIIWFVPFAVSAVMILSSPLTGWIYTINDADMLETGPLYMVMIIVTSLYLLTVLIVSLINAIRAKTSSKRKTSIQLMAAVGILVVYDVLDNFTHNTSVFPAAISAVIMVIFILVQDSNFNTDVLTGLPNRRKAYDYLSVALATVSETDPVYLYMGDLNNLKDVNDEFGHLEGDDALKICARALRHAASRFDGFTARLGGDEFLFVVQPHKGDRFDPEQVVDYVAEELTRLTEEKGKPYNLTCSFGYARCSRQTQNDTEECIRLADEHLYETKKAFHAELEIRK